DERDEIIIAVESGKTAVSLPINAVDRTSNRSIALTGDAFRADIPAELLKQLRQLSAEQKLEDANIVFSFAPIEAAQRQARLDTVSEQHAANIRGLSELLEIGLTLTDKDGAEIQSGKLLSPITITFDAAVVSGMNPDLVGIYQIADDGTLVYVGGMLKNGQISAEIQSGGNYVSLEFNKSFEDVSEQHWAHRTIKQMAAKLIAKGVSETNFAPERDVTRAEFTALLV